MSMGLRRIYWLQWTSLAYYSLILSLPLLVIFTVFVGYHVQKIVNILQLLAYVSCCSFGIVHVNKTPLILLLSRLPLPLRQKLLHLLLCPMIHLPGSQFNACVDPMLQLFEQFLDSHLSDTETFMEKFVHILHLCIHEEWPCICYATVNCAYDLLAVCYALCMVVWVWLGCCCFEGTG